MNYERNTTSKTKQSDLLPMKKLELRVDGVNLGFAIQTISNAILMGKTIKLVISEWREKRSLSQNAFIHVIFEEISKYLISKGRTDWTPEYTKENLKSNFLGWTEQEFIDVKTGVREVKLVLRKTSKLDKGEAFFFTTQLLDFAESIGCKIKIPDNCDYMRYIEEQNR